MRLFGSLIQILEPVPDNLFQNVVVVKVGSNPPAQLVFVQIDLKQFLLQRFL